MNKKKPVINANHWYVYTYRDPNDSRPFYVGKGTDYRVFSHASGLGSKETERRIRAIRKRNQEPVIEIVARNLADDTAYAIEMALIEFVGIENLTNKQRGRGYKEHGKIAATQLNAHICGESVSEKDFAECPSIIFRINKLYRGNMTDAELYDATRCCWDVDINRAKTCKYAMATYQGRILAIYEIAAWFPAGSTFMMRGMVPQDNDRFEFVGRLCKNKKIIKRFLGHSIAQLQGYNSRSNFLYFGISQKGK